MQLAANQLPAQLQKGLRSLYTLHGDEPLLIQEAGDAIRAAARAQGHTERTVHTMAGAHADWSAVLASGASLSLFAERQIVEVRVPSGKPGKDGSAALQQLAEAADGNDSTLTLVILPRLDMATQKSAWFAALDAHGVTVRVDPVDRKALPQWIAQRLQAQGQRVAAGEEGQRTLAFFADRVEGNLLAAHQEIQKLALLHPAGQLARVQRMLDGLQAEGEAAVLVHWALAEDIRTLNRVRAAMDAGRPLPLALRESRVWGVKEKLIERVLPVLSATQLARWLDDAHTVDGIVKGLKSPDWPADPWQALQQLAMKVARACAVR
ncbi:MAG: DNA polymerase III subunit delta [Hydrogenophaga sp.]|nr:DNA polymerase III subunit delta [Hydrogenophaga sp.]